MKILVANPPSFEGEIFIREGRCSQPKKIWNTVWPPYSLVSIAAVLEELGHNIKVYDYPSLQTKSSDFFAFLNAFCPKAVILSCTTPTVKNDLAACLKIKQLLPQTKIILFGIHGTVFSEELLQKYSL